MKLRFSHLLTKVALVVLPITFIGAGIMVVACLTIILPGFQGIEDQGAEKNADRAVDMVNNRLAELQQKSSDWGDWDDPYQYMKTRNKSFVSDNLQPNSLKDLSVDYIMFYDTNHQLVVAQHVDDETAGTSPVEPSVTGLLNPTSALLQTSDVNSLHSGLVVLPQGILMIVTRPILTSDGSGPSRGTLVFAQYLDAGEQQALSNLGHISATYGAANDSADTTATAADRAAKAAGRAWVIHESASVNTSYRIINDVFGAPTIAIKVSQSRAVSQQGRSSLYDLFLLQGLIGVVAALAAIIAINNMIVRRVVRLSQELDQLKNSGSDALSVSAGGDDELGKLGGAINALLMHLHESRSLELANATLAQQAQEAATALDKERHSVDDKVSERTSELQDLKKSLEERVEERTKELNTQLDQMRRLNELMVDRELRMKELKAENARLRQQSGDKT